MNYCVFGGVGVIFDVIVLTETRLNAIKQMTELEGYDLLHSKDTWD